MTPPPLPFEALIALEEAGVQVRPDADLHAVEVTVTTTGMRQEYLLAIDPALDLAMRLIGACVALKRGAEGAP